MMYQIPEECFFRIHHSRPRFKNDVESVLLYMASAISNLEQAEDKIFRVKLNELIKHYPGNSSIKLKTINNWRTEISSFFGFIEHDGKQSMPGKIAILLSESQDLIEFFRYFLFYFQYPGGHLKPHETLKYLKNGVKFKPAKYIIQVLFEGYKISEKFGITGVEAANCIFNDLRVTRGDRSPEETAKLIWGNREKKDKYNRRGDFVRYAKDILDYMVLADLIRLRKDWTYCLNLAYIETLNAFADSNEYFKPYLPLYNKLDLKLEDVKATQDEWFRYVNNRLDSNIFKADALFIIEEADRKAPQEENSLIKEVLRNIRSRRGTAGEIAVKEIGDIGETISFEHEIKRLTKLNKEALLHLIKKIPNNFAVGFDIQSFEGTDDDIHRYIEVKTTISMGKVAASNFHMTANEWRTANSFRDLYHIYRIMISINEVGLFIIKDPVGKYKQDLLNMAPKDGADINYTDKSGYWEPLLS